MAAARLGRRKAATEFLTTELSRRNRQAAEDCLLHSIEAMQQVVGDQADNDDGEAEHDDHRKREAHGALTSSLGRRWR